LLGALLAAVAASVDGFVVDAADVAAGASWWCRDGALIAVR
jgi:hypothetical protein